MVFIILFLFFSEVFFYFWFYEFIICVFFNLDIRVLNSLFMILEFELFLIEDIDVISNWKFIFSFLLLNIEFWYILRNLVGYFLRLLLFGKLCILLFKFLRKGICLVFEKIRFFLFKFLNIWNIGMMIVWLGFCMCFWYEWNMFYEYFSDFCLCDYG